MRKLITCMSATLLLISCAKDLQGDQAVSSIPASPMQCHLKVQFGSFASGVDRAAAAAVERLIRRSALIESLDRSRYGIEGEYEICIRTKSGGDAELLYAQIKAALPKTTAAPVRLMGPSTTYSLPDAVEMRQQR